MPAPAPRPEFLFTAPPTVGVVVGTFGSVPYVALQLEARRRFWPDIPLLVHDDGSDDRDALAALCRAYGADFAATSKRQGHVLGDLASLVGGLDWADGRVDLLVKWSRRFLVYHPWAAPLQMLAVGAQYATYSHACADYFMRFRSECAAFHIGAWRRSATLRRFRQALETGETLPMPIENWYHARVREVHREAAPVSLVRREQVFSRDPSWDGYGLWAIMGQGRHSVMPGVLWHDCNPPDDYFALAQAWGLPYTLADFRLPGGSASPGCMPSPVRPAPASAAALDPQRIEAQTRGAAFIAPDEAAHSLDARCGKYDRVWSVIAARSLRRNRSVPWNTVRRLRPLISAARPYLQRTDYTGQPLYINGREDASVAEALKEPRDLGYERFVARRVAEYGGALLSVGATGLHRVALARTFDAHAAIVVVGTRREALTRLSANVHLRGISGVFCFATGETDLFATGETDLAPATAQIAAALPRVGVVVLSQVTGVGDFARTLLPLIQRDRPCVIIEGTERGPAADVLVQTLTGQGYGGWYVAPDHTFRPLDAPGDEGGWLCALSLTHED